MTTELEKENPVIDLSPSQISLVLSEREINILRFVNEFGFCDIRHIKNRFDMKKTNAYSQMQILARLEFLMHVSSAQKRSGVFCLTTKGIRLLELDLPALARIPTGLYNHHLTVIDVHLRLRELYPDAAWISERRLIREKYGDRLRKKEHLPDGVLSFPDSRQVAIEVERSLKARTRLDEILLSYALQKYFKEVWYFCSPETFSVITAISSDLHFVKIHHLEDFLL